jgi:hypothetical protein
MVFVIQSPVSQARPMAGTNAWMSSMSAEVALPPMMARRGRRTSRPASRTGGDEQQHVRQRLDGSDSEVGHLHGTGDISAGTALRVEGQARDDDEGDDEQGPEQPPPRRNRGPYERAGEDGEKQDGGGEPRRLDQESGEHCLTVATTEMRPPRSRERRSSEMLPSAEGVTSSDPERRTGRSVSQ